MGDKYDGVAVDLWSCGCILLFMLAAAPAFSGVPPCSQTDAARVACARLSATDFWTARVYPKCEGYRLNGPGWAIIFRRF